MAKTHPPHAPEFGRQIVDLVRAGRTPQEPAREFEPWVQAIRNWAAKADRQEGRLPARLATPTGAPCPAAGEREELARLWRENKQLKLERDILLRATAWFARATGVLPPGSSGS